MLRKVIFRDTVTGEELMLPVTPSVLEGETAVNIELTNISGLGDVSIPGTGALVPLNIDCLFPAQHYPFCVVTPLEPYSYVDKFVAWAEGGRVLRYIWSGTKINVPVLIESIKFREDDGTNDVKAVISMRQYRYITAEFEPLSSAADAEVLRADERAPEGEQLHVVVWGDTLSGICRTYYGDASCYPQLASFNNIANPHLIHPGELIRIPPRSVLDGMSPKAPTLMPVKAVSKSGGSSKTVTVTRE